MRNTDMVPVILLNSLSPCFWGRASGKFPLVLSSTVFPNIKLLISLAFWSGAGQLWASSGFYPEPKPHALGLVCSPPPPTWLELPALWFCPQIPHWGPLVVAAGPPSFGLDSGLPPVPTFMLGITGGAHMAFCPPLQMTAGVHRPTSVVTWFLLTHM